MDNDERSKSSPEIRLSLIFGKYNPKPPPVGYHDFYEVLAIAEVLRAALQKIIDRSLNIDECRAIADKALSGPNEALYDKEH